MRRRPGAKPAQIFGIAGHNDPVLGDCASEDIRVRGAAQPELLNVHPSAARSGPFAYLRHSRNASASASSGVVISARRVIAAFADRASSHFICGLPGPKCAWVGARRGSFEGVMIVIGTESVERYFAAHRGNRGIRAARSQYEVWLAIARRAQWRNPEEVKASHPRASILRGGRVVFNIKGNDYRLIVAVQYQAGVLVIRFFGSHAEYDRIDAETV
jgi:mRNA interferase HigB